jgi:CS domain
MAPDVHKSDFKLELQPTKLTFTGKSATKNLTYHADFDFFADIDPDKSKINHSDRDIELVLSKKDLDEEFWPRLLKDKAKVHWLKTDFDKVRHILVAFLLFQLRILNLSASGSMRTSKILSPKTTTTCPRWAAWAVEPEAVCLI